MSKNYINAQTFQDFKSNQDKLIEILNHNMTDMRTDIKCISKDLSEVVGSFKVTQKLVWWILGIIASFTGIIAIGLISQI